MKALIDLEALAAAMAPALMKHLAKFGPDSAAAVTAERNRLLTPRQVALWAHCKVKSVYDAIRDGQLAAHERAGARTGVMAGKPRYLVRAQDAVAWIESRGTSGGGWTRLGSEARRASPRSR